MAKTYKQNKPKKRVKVFSVTINDCKVDTFTVGGRGGAGKDTSNTGVRVSHLPSGASGVAVDTRSQFKNKQLAFGRMANSKAFQAWAKLTASEIVTGKTVDERVDEAMEEKNLKVEVRGENGWEPVRGHARTCPAYGNYQPPYEECDCGYEEN